MATTLREMLLNSGSWQAYDANLIASRPGTVRLRKSDPAKPGIYFYSNEQTVQAAPVPGVVKYGYDAARDEGTEGDFFVSPTGSNSNPGTAAQPFATIAHALSAAPELSRIKLRGGVYRETVNLYRKKNLTISRYGTEQVTISGRQHMTGWTQCTLADIDTVGPNYAEIWKKTVPNVTFVGSPRAAFLHEAGDRLTLAALKVPFPFRPTSDNDMSDWLTSDETVVDGGGKILGYRKASITDKYTSAQLTGAKIGFHRAPNSATTSVVAGVEGGVILLADQTWEYEGNSNRDKFVIINVAAAMKPGGWAYTQSGSDTTLYVRPKDPISVAGAIEYSARGSGFNTLEAENITVRGIIVTGVASDGTKTDGLYAVGGLNVAGGRKYSGLTFENMVIEDTWRDFDSYGAFTFRNVDNLTIRNVTIRRTVGQTGISCAGSLFGSTYGMDKNIHVEFCDFEDIDRAPVRIFGGSDSWIAFCRARNCAFGPHANKGNIYETASRCLWWGCIWIGCGGYLTWQEADSQDICFCVVPSGTGMDGHSVIDQNHASLSSPATQMGVDTISYICNNLLIPLKNVVGQANSLRIGTQWDPNVYFAVHNNVLNGATVYAGRDQIASWSHNIFTSGTPRDATDSAAALAAVYEDVLAGNLSVKADSPSRSAAAANLTAVIAALQARYPTFQYFDRDLAFEVFDPAAPFVGPYGPGSDEIDVGAVWVEPAQILGISEEGETYTLVGGYVNGMPYPTVTRQWVRADDEWTVFTPIPGATGSSYTMTADDVGSKVGCILDAGGAQTVATIDKVIEEASTIPFSPRGALFDGTAVMRSNSLTIPAGDSGMISTFFTLDDASWNLVAGRRMWALGGTTSASLYIASGGRFTLRIENTGETQTHTFFAAPGNVPFVTGRYYHLAIEWAPGGMKVFVDGVQVYTYAFDNVTFAGVTQSQFAVGGQLTGTTFWLGRLGHFWASLNQRLDLTVPGNMAKLLNGKLPANMGANGGLVTGLQPQFYFDGEGDAWQNQGSVGALPKTGVLIAAGPPELP